MNKVKKVIFLFRYIRIYFLTNILLSVACNLLQFPGKNSGQAEGEPASPSLTVYRTSTCLYRTSTTTGQIFVGKINIVAVPTIQVSTTVTSSPTPPRPSSSNSNGHGVAASVPTRSAATVPSTSSLPTISVPTSFHSESTSHL